MFNSFKALWGKHPTLRRNIEAEIITIIGSSPHAMLSEDIFNSMTINKNPLRLILAGYSSSSGFRQPQSHIGSIAAEMAHRGIIRHIKRRIKGKTLSFFY